MIETLLRNYFDAGYPVVAVETAEEKRLLNILKDARLGNKIFSIATVAGFINETQQSILDAQSNFTKAFGEFARKYEESIMMVYDFQHMVASATSYRPLLQNLDLIKSKGNMVILVAPNWKLPEELKHNIPVIKMDLPSREELEAPLQVVATASGKKINNRNELTSAARGLTLEQAENVFALSEQSNFSKALVEREKMRLVRSEYMIVEQPRDPSKLAGLGQLKAYIHDEVLAARDDDQLRVKGILLVGVPGTGKSLSARVSAAILQWPLIRLDLSACKGSLVGQSESNVRKALALADAIAPCILWLDEVEKAVGGHQSSAAVDGGTTLAMIGTFLTWQQEHLSPVTTVATCNDYAKLPAEMTRAGRFDERFFLDLPSRNEREEIAKVHLDELHCDINLADAIAEMAEDWTGAEIEQLIKSTARQTQRKLSISMLERCKEQIIPISRTGSIKQLREWASTNLRRANDIEELPTLGPRKVRR
jgi:hypothetical protein